MTFTSLNLKKKKKKKKKSENAVIAVTYYGPKN